MATRKEKAAKFEGEGYRVNVVGRNVLVTDAMKNYAEEKVSKIERISHRIIDITVRMDIQKLEHCVDIVLIVDHTTMKSHAASNDMYVSIDKAVEKLQKQLRRYKTKVQAHQAQHLAIVDMKVNVFRRAEEEETLDVNLDIEEENRQRLIDEYRPHEIVKQETMPLKILTYDEAIHEMEKSSEKTFMVFRRQDDMQLKIIYRRDDGDYAVIEPEA